MKRLMVASPVSAKSRCSILRRYSPELHAENTHPAKPDGAELFRIVEHRSSLHQMHCKLFSGVNPEFLRPESRSPGEPLELGDGVLA